MDSPELPENPYLVRLDHNDVRTRTGLISLVFLFDELHKGRTPENLVRNYPPLTLEIVRALLAYYDEHRELVDRYIAREHQLCEENFQAYLAKPPPPVVTRLRALKAKKSA